MTSAYLKAPTGVPLAARDRPPADEPVWFRILVSAFVLCVVFALTVTFYVPSVLALLARSAVAGADARG